MNCVICNKSFDSTYYFCNRCNLYYDSSTKYKTIIKGKMNNEKAKNKYLKAEADYLKASGWIVKKNEYGEIVWSNPKIKSPKEMKQEIAASVQRENDDFNSEYGK